MRAKKREVLTEVTLVRHVRSTNRNFYYYRSLIYFRSPERAAAGFRLNYREPGNKALSLSLFPIWPIEDYRPKIRTPKYDTSIVFLNVLTTKYSFNTNFFGSPSKLSFNYRYTDIPNILFFNLMFIFHNVIHNVSHNMKL